jgi:hypothetical protein
MRGREEVIKGVGCKKRLYRIIAGGMEDIAQHHARFFGHNIFFLGLLFQELSRQPPRVAIQKKD